VVAERPGFAALTAKTLGGLRPVGGPAKAFAKAETFAEALEAAIQNEALLNKVAEIRMTDSEVYTNSNGRAAIFYYSENDEEVTYYVGRTALTLLQPGAEDTYDPRELISSMIREIVVYPHVLKRIADHVREDEKHAQLMEGFGKQVANNKVGAN